jgi:glucose/arabinose dehydrogenase
MTLVYSVWFAGARAAAAQSIIAVPVVDELAQPVLVTQPPDGTQRLFVVEKAGRIQLAVDGVTQPQPFLDISDVVNSRGTEQGLLGLAFHPAFANNRAFFVAYTGRNGDSTVARYRASDDPNRADRSSGTVVLSIPHAEFANHNGGNLVFGPDGFLYIGTGDGGGGGDPHGNAQNLQSLLGKMLRIDVDSARPYGVPPSNPFIGQDARPEVWAYGLRNPWRYSFDLATGDLYIADVGQDRWEEVDFQPAGDPGGQNYGWNVMEGLHCYRPASNCDPTGLTLPIAEYGHNLGCAIIGGHVYRGLLAPSLVGAYVFGDECSARVWSLRQGTYGGWVTTELLRMQGTVISSFGEDQAGEVYVVDLTGTVFMLLERP